MEPVLIKIYRDAPKYKGGPTEAEVKLEDLQDCINGGWKVAGTEGVAKTPDADPDELVEIYRESPKRKNGPVAAKVKRSELADCIAGGWIQKGEKPPAKAASKPEDPERSNLLELAIELGLDKPSALKKWGVKRLKDEVEKAQAEINAQHGGGPEVK